MSEMKWNRWRIQKISEGMVFCRRTRRTGSKSHFQNVFVAVKPIFFVFIEKKWGKKFHEVVVVVGPPNGGFATEWNV